MKVIQGKNYTLYGGDCLDVLDTLPDNSVDAIITDPPYEIGFMGKKWDNTGIAFNVDMWKKALRVLKHGGHLLAFNHSRMFHRMAVAIEDAGFEIRDTIMWLYGCLSTDTEIMTANGWEHYHKGILDNSVLCYNVENNTFEFHKPTKEYLYENQHTAYHIKSNNTDQIVSRNHRVLVERDGTKVFAYAETLERQENIPFLESLQDLPETIYDFHKGTSIEKHNLLSIVSKQDNQKATPTINEILGTKKLSSVRQEVLGENIQKPKILFSSMQRNNKGARVEATRTQRSCELETRKRTSEQRKMAWREKPILERWNNLLQQAWKLFADKICALPTRIFSHVEKRWLCHGTSLNNGGSSWALPFENRGSPSHQSQPTRQSAREPNDVSIQSRTQTIRSTRAKIEPIKYKGNVWCVEVPTGCFVARRKGKIFITGNSGFPKSLNIGLAVDKLNGVESKIVGKVKGSGTTGTNSSGNQQFVAKNQHEDGTFDLKQAQNEWSGWGTALKPAFEPIILARKPIKESSIAQNVLKWGVGGINIDECRVETDDHYAMPEKKTPCAVGYQGKNKSMFCDKTAREMNSLGRFPANVIHDGSDEVVSGFPNTISGGGEFKAEDYKEGNGNTPFTRGDFNGYDDSGSASRFFYTAKANKRDRDEGLDIAGFDEASPMEQTGRKEGSLGLEYIDEKGNTHQNPYAGTKSYKRNIHPTVKPTDLMAYLVRLITPKGGVVLDMFMGSGSTGKACVFENADRNANYKFIGIELMPEYLELSQARIEWAIKFIEEGYDEVVVNGKKELVKPISVFDFDWNEKR